MMASALADAGIDAIYSYAGRTKTPVTQPLPTRIGGFGGVAGLRDYLRAEQITHIIDATHPFAAGMSHNAQAAAGRLPLIRLERPPWLAQVGDKWTHFAQLEDIPDALPEPPSRIFLAIGKQQVDRFAARPEHHYLLRLVDTPKDPLALPNITVVLARGPFDLAGDTALMDQHQITHVVAKNAGGAGARAKLDAARALGLPVLMADRPALPDATIAKDPVQVMRWLSHWADRGV